MSRLYVFAIGGTGSRVVKALTMLLASGVHADASEIIPIIVDPHLSNEDLRRTIVALDNYQAIYNELGDNRKEGFFHTKISTLQELDSGQNGLKKAFAFELAEVKDANFTTYIAHGSLDQRNEDFMSLLFSKTNLNTKMDEGFYGNPNMGSVVLNQFKDSEEFKYFVTKFAQGDRIFIISSIFGGTGAAGFPLILKNIRQISTNVHAQRAAIGAVTVLPYFGVGEAKDGKIEKNDFFPKTTAALSYYANNVTGNQSLNALYYLGDAMNSDYTNDSGSGGQKNAAHLVEMAAAMSILDFLTIPNADLTNEVETIMRNGQQQSVIRATKLVCKEFGVLEDNNTLNFNMLGIKTQSLVKKPLTQYLYFCRYLRDQFSKAISSNQPFVMETKPHLDDSFKTSPFYKVQMTKFNEAFETWLKEMAGNNRSFEPFDLKTEEMAAMLKSIQTRRTILGPKTINYDKFQHALNRYSGEQHSNATSKLLNTFYKATNYLIKNFYDGF